MKTLIGIVMALIFALTCSIATAADSFYVVKDKGTCKILKAKEKPAATISGPFKTKALAKKAKAKSCPKVKTTIKPKPVTPTSVAPTKPELVTPLIPGVAAPEKPSVFK